MCLCSCVFGVFLCFCVHSRPTWAHVSRSLCLGSSRDMCFGSSRDMCQRCPRAGMLWCASATRRPRSPTRSSRQASAGGRGGGGVCDPARCLPRIASATFEYLEFLVLIVLELLVTSIFGIWYLVFVLIFLESISLVVLERLVRIGFVGRVLEFKCGA